MGPSKSPPVGSSLQTATFTPNSTTKVFGDELDQRGATRFWCHRSRGVHRLRPPRLLQRPGEVGAHVPRDRRPCDTRSPATWPRVNPRRDLDPALAAGSNVHQLRRREGLSGGGRRGCSRTRSTAWSTASCSAPTTSVSVRPSPLWSRSSLATPPRPTTSSAMPGTTSPVTNCRRRSTSRTTCPAHQTERRITRWRENSSWRGCVSSRRAEGLGEI